MIDPEVIDDVWSQTGFVSNYLIELKQICRPVSETASVKSKELGHLPTLFCELHSGESRQVAPLVTAWTILRYAARLLDDVEDQDRKVRETAESVQLNFSTGLIFTASAVLNTLENRGVSPETASDIRHRFYTELLKTCSGQHMDLTNKTPSLEVCWQMVGEKSGAFLGLICWAGGRLACTDTHQLHLYYQFGHTLGVLDQIRDDLADLWPNETHHSNLSLKKWNLPIAYAFSVLPNAQKQQLAVCLQTPSPAHESAAVELIVQSGAGAYLTLQSMIYYQQGAELLAQMGLPKQPYQKLMSLLDKAKMPAGI